MPLKTFSPAAAVTLVCPADTELQRWSGGDGGAHFTIVQDIDILEGILRSPIASAAGEIVRVVIDGGAEIDRFLVLVATLPHSFDGELLYVRRDGSGHLSTRELKMGRTVRSINDVEVEVYLRWHGLPARSRNSYRHEVPAQAASHGSAVMRLAQ